VEIDLGTVRGLLTAALIVVYAGIFLWAWSPKREAAFSAAARAPLEEDAAPAPAAAKGGSHE